MCIIAVKPANARTPDRGVLKTMFERNPDGAGIMYALDGVLVIKKGLMSFTEFVKAVDSIPEQAAAVIHCRITTSGGTCKELTHPFVLDADINQQRRTEYKGGGVGVAHNGVFSEFNYKPLNNDTTQFISSYLAPLKALKDRSGGSVQDADMAALINQLVSGSRLVLLDASGKINMYGSGWAQADGVWYSNTTYKPLTYSCNKYWNKSPAFDKFCEEYKEWGLTQEELKDLYRVLAYGY